VSFFQSALETNDLEDAHVKDLEDEAADDESDEALQNALLSLVGNNELVVLSRKWASMFFLKHPNIGLEEEPTRGRFFVNFFLEFVEKIIFLNVFRGKLQFFPTFFWENFLRKMVQFSWKFSWKKVLRNHFQFSRENSLEISVKKK
jgi:hypothetical protein